MNSRKRKKTISKIYDQGFKAGNEALKLFEKNLKEGLKIYKERHGKDTNKEGTKND